MIALIASAMLEQRLKDLTAAMTARMSGVKPAEPVASASGSTARSEYFASEQQSSQNMTRVPAGYPTPSASSGPSRTQTSNRSQHKQSDTSMDGGEPLPVQNLVSDDEEEVPLAQIRGFPSRPQRPPPPPVDDYDIAMAEQEAEADLPATPGRRRARVEEEEDIPPEALFSSPPVAIPPPKQQPVRVSASAARSIQAQAGPWTQRTRPAAAQILPSPTLGGPRPSEPQRRSTSEEERSAVKADTKYPWSDELRTRLRVTFRLPGFRKHQKEAIDATLSGKDGRSAHATDLISQSLCSCLPEAANRSPVSWHEFKALIQKLMCRSTPSCLQARRDQRHHICHLATLVAHQRPDAPFAQT